MFGKFFKPLGVFIIISFIGLFLGWIFDSLSGCIGVPIWLLFIIGGLFFGLAIYAYGSWRELQTLSSSVSDPKDAKKSVKPLKSLPGRFELVRLTYPRAEWIVHVKSWFSPFQKPNLEDFVKALKLSDPICGDCKSDFMVIRAHGSIASYYCGNASCGASTKGHIKSDVLYDVGNREFNKLNGRIRKDFDTYWKTYVKALDDFTGKDYDKYVLP